MSQEQTKDDAFEAQVKEQINALMALDDAQRKAIVDACTVVIGAITDRDALVVMVRKDIGNEYMLRTAAWGCGGPADIAEMMVHAVANIAEGGRAPKEALQ